MAASTSATSQSSASSPAPSSPPAVPRLAFGVQVAYLTLLACSLLGLLHLIPVYPHMMLTVLSTLYIGAHSSVSCHLSESTVTERMQTRDAMMFPVIGSVVLFSLYLVFKLVDKAYVNVVIKAYFFLFGAIVLTAKVDGLLEQTLPTSWVRALTSTSVTVRHPLTIWPLTYLADKPTPSVSDPTSPSPPSPPTPEAETVVVTPLFGLSVTVALLVAVSYLLSNHWLLSNVFGVAFSLQGIELLSLGSYLNGLILLCGLFVYDIFWVFGTEVMVTVAKSFDAPIKLLFPQMGGVDERPSMLGLGDIVIPGIFIALLLRYDYFHFQRTSAQGAQGGVVHPRPHLHVHGGRGEAATLPAPASTPYFNAVMLCYFIGLSVTVGVMYWFKAAQPALLYLVPACIGGSLFTAVRLGEVSQMMKYVEGEKAEVAKEGSTAAVEVKKAQ